MLKFWEWHKSTGYMNSEAFIFEERTQLATTLHSTIIYCRLDKYLLGISELFPYLAGICTLPRANPCPELCKVTTTPTPPHCCVFVTVKHHSNVLKTLITNQITQAFVLRGLLLRHD